MAIKIKNKGKERPEDELDQEGGPSVPAGAPAPGSGLDGFERATFLAAAWIEDNRSLFFAMIGLAVVAIIAVVIGVNYVRGQEVEASNRLSEGLAAYEKPVEGSPDLEALRNQPNIPDLPEGFASSEEKWNIVYGAAEHTLSDFDRGPIASSARLVKAASALNLGNYEEAAQLYQQIIAGSEAPTEVEAAAQMGLAQSLAPQGDLQGAQSALERFGELLPDRKVFAEFELARMFERHGDADEARQRYEQFLQDHGESPYSEEVERRNALL